MDLTPKTPSRFRAWVYQLWIENSEEHLTYGESPYKIKEYWAKHKYWLKHQFKKALQ